MSDQAFPLWPDGTNERYYRCWNCGKGAKYTVAGSSSVYVCDCGCGWSVRFGVHTAEAELGKLKIREDCISRASHIELVDFTKPDALSSPA